MDLHLAILQLLLYVDKLRSPSPWVILVQYK